MSRQDALALTQILLVVAGIVLVVLVFYLAWLPGKVARERRHPSVDAIALCGWLSLLLWPLWFVAIIWAHSVPKPTPRRASSGRGFDPVPPDIDREIEKMMRGD